MASKEAIENYCDELFSISAIQSEFFYRSGVQDGYKLFQYIENILKTGNIQIL